MDEMSAPKQVPYRSKRFGQRLRELREDAGLTLDQVVELLREKFDGTNSRFKRISRPTISRIELGETEIDPSTELTAFLTIYGVNDMRLRLELRQRAEQVRQRIWIERMLTDQAFADFLWAESIATDVDNYCFGNLPGSLQEPAFAERWIRYGERGRSTDAEIDTYIDIRKARAGFLLEENRPNTRFLLHEALLRQRLRIFTPEDYATQYRHLKHIAETYDNVDIRYLPIDTDCPAAGDVSAGFTILHLPDGWSTLTHVETPIGALVSDESPRVNWAVDTFESLWSEGAKSAEQTIDFLDEMLRNVEK